MQLREDANERVLAPVLGESFKAEAVTGTRVCDGAKVSYFDQGEGAGLAQFISLFFFPLLSRRPKMGEVKRLRSKVPRRNELLRVRGLLPAAQQLGRGSRPRSAA